MGADHHRHRPGEAVGAAGDSPTRLIRLIRRKAGVHGAERAAAVADSSTQADGTAAAEDGNEEAAADSVAAVAADGSRAADAGTEGSGSSSWLGRTRDGCSSGRASSC